MKFRALLALFLISTHVQAAGLGPYCQQDLQTPQQLAEALIIELGSKIPGEFVFEHRSLRKIATDAYVLKRVEGDKVIGQLDYNIEFYRPNRIHVQWIETKADFLRRGVSKLLYAEMIRRHPEIKSIYGSLDEMNAELFEQNLARVTQERPDLNELRRRIMALRQTPAYRARAQLGFGKILKLGGEYLLNYEVVKDFSRKP